MNAEGSLTIMSSTQVIAVAAVHKNLKVSEYPSVRGISVMEMPEMLQRNVLRRIPLCCRDLGVLTEFESMSDEDIVVAITRLVGVNSKDLSSDFPAEYV